jgi:hypothetical protein
VTGTSLTYEGDWHALFDMESLPQDGFNGRLLRWINLKLTATFTELNGAMQALADNFGAYNFSSLGTFDASVGPPGVGGSPIGLLLALTKAS